MNRNNLKLPNVWPVTCHTDHVGSGSTFVAIKGYTHNGTAFIPLAIKKGATQIIISLEDQLTSEVQQQITYHSVKVTRVSNTRLALAQLSAQAYANPADKLTIIGITGTNGKTTTAYILHHILQQTGIKAALLSTVENKIGQRACKGPLTTPQPDYLHMFFDVCVKQKVTHLIMEVTAQALSLHRVHGILFDVGVITNVTHEHLEFYETMDDYFAAKCILLDHIKPNGCMVLNDDDTWCQRITDLKGRRFIRMSIKHPFDDISTVVSSVAPELIMQIHIAQKRYVLHSPFLLGIFNAYNLLTALLVACELQVPMPVIIQAVYTFTGLTGRLQKHSLSNGALCYIDYAHTPASYEQVLQLLRSFTDHLIVIFGCAGHKDPSKRPKMGALAARLADSVILTSDNPGYEQVDDINADIMAGMHQRYRHKVDIIDDRQQAIIKAYAQSKKGTIIALLGKGPDEMQCIKGKCYYFSDTQVVKELSALYTIT